MGIGAARNEENPALAPSRVQHKGSRHSGRSDVSTQPTETFSEVPPSRDTEPNGPAANPFMSWDELGLGQEEFGFLGRFDLPDLASWFSGVPDL